MSEERGSGARGLPRPQGIVVGVDGSSQSLCALVWAAAEAEKRNAPLHIVTAYTVPVFAASSMDAGYATLDDSIIREGAEAVVQEALQKVESFNVSADGRVETGDAAGVLLDLSEEAELMVVGTRGRGGFVGRLLGSVSSALPAHAKCPTVTIPLAAARRLPAAEVQPPKDAVDAVVEPVVIVGVDGSEQARMASLVAADQAQRWGYPLRVLCALPPFTGSLAWVPEPLDRDAMTAEIEVQLKAGKAWLQSHFPRLPIEVSLVDGAPVEIMTEASRTAELVVVGTRGRGGFAGMLLGSTSQGVLHHAKGPVMVVPDAKDPRMADRPSFGPVAS